MENNIKGKVKAYYESSAKKINTKSKASCGCDTSCCGDNSNLYKKDFIEGLHKKL